MASLFVNLNMTAAAFVDSRTPDANHPLQVGENILLHRSDDLDEHSRVYMQFEPFSSSLKRKRLIRVSEVRARPVLPYNVAFQDSSARFFLRATDSFDEDTLTWNSRPAGTNPLLFYTRNSSANSDIYYTTGILFYKNKGWEDHPETPSIREQSECAKAVLKNSAIYLYNSRIGTSDQALTIQYGYKLSESDSWRYAAPQLVIEYENVDISSQITAMNHTAGYVNPAAAQTFEWDFLSSDPNYVCAGDFDQASASFFWKEHGSAGSYTEVQASGSTKSVTIPANTFPAASSIDWYVAGTDEDGTSTSSSVYTLTTTDADCIATALAPINTVEDGSATIVFRWNLANEYGNTASRVEVLWKLPSEDENSWHTLVDENSAITSYSAPAGTFTAGEVQWKVRSYNQDSVAGPYDAKSFVCVAAPQAPDGISCDGVPYATIRWQCAGQQAYEVSVDGVSLGVKFGTDKALTLDEPLSDGEHTVSIKAQGRYNLWSQPGSAVISISNTPGNAVTLSGEGGLDAALTWKTDDTVQNFFIYRDDVRIGHTEADVFTDRLALGNHSYFVINRLPSGNYTKSNAVSLNMDTEENRIAVFPPVEWLDIRLSERSSPLQQFSWQQTVSTRHFFGASYPIAEISPFEDSTASYDTGFLTADECRTFEALRGKTVCVKSRMGMVFVGVLGQMKKSVNGFYASYSFSVTRTHWEDYVDE